MRPLAPNRSIASESSRRLGGSRCACGRAFERFDHEGVGSAASAKSELPAFDETREMRIDRVGELAAARRVHAQERLVQQHQLRVVR